MREGTGTSLGVAGAVTTFFVLLGGILAVATYVLVSMYAIVKIVGGSQDHPNPVALVVGFVLVTFTFVVLVLVGVRYLGGSLNSRSRETD